MDKQFEPQSLYPKGKNKGWRKAGSGQLGPVDQIQPTLQMLQSSQAKNRFYIFKQLEKQKCSCSVMSDSLQPHGLYPARLLHPWDFPGKNSVVGCHFLLQGIFTTQGSNPGLPHCRWTPYHLSHQGSLMSIFIPLVKLFAQGYLPHTLPPPSDDFYLQLCLDNTQTHCILNLPSEQRFSFKAYLLYSSSGFCQEIKRTVLFSLLLIFCFRYSSALEFRQSGLISQDQINQAEFSDPLAIFNSTQQKKKKKIFKGNDILIQFCTVYNHICFTSLPEC